MKLTIITPTVGNESLYKLVNSLFNQTDKDVEIEHIFLWDLKRNNNFDLNHFNEFIATFKSNNYEKYFIEIPFNFVFGNATGSALRSIGLIVARGNYVSFADDDVWFEKEYLTKIKNAYKYNYTWGYFRRKIWYQDECLGVDNFESVGNSCDRKVSYEMVDNSSMFFLRELGVHAAFLYRETYEYNDDRLMYNFLKSSGGTPYINKDPFVNHNCPKKLYHFFKENCLNNLNQLSDVNTDNTHKSIQLAQSLALK